MPAANKKFLDGNKSDKFHWKQFGHYYKYRIILDLSSLVFVCINSLKLCRINILIGNLHLETSLKYKVNFGKNTKVEGSEDKTATVY